MKSWHLWGSGEGVCRGERKRWSRQVEETLVKSLARKEEELEPFERARESEGGAREKRESARSLATRKRKCRSARVCVCVIDNDVCGIVSLLRASH